MVEHNLKACDLRCSIDGISRRKDFSATIRLSTERECTRELYHDLVDLQGAMARIIIAPDGVDPDAQISNDSDQKERGSPSKRLRNVIYRRWQQSEEKDSINFDQYHKLIMEDFIDQMIHLMET